MYNYYNLIDNQYMLNIYLLLYYTWDILLSINKYLMMSLYDYYHMMYIKYNYIYYMLNM